MSRSEHTPGPWYVDDEPGIVVTRDGHPVAHIVSGSDADFDLVLAAPDLLAALEATANRLEMAASDAGGRGDFSDRDGYMAVALRARAAITKAKGDPPCSTA